MYNLKFFLKHFVNDNPQIKQKILEKKIKENWDILFKKTFDRQLTSIELNGDVLKISISSASLRNDLFMKKEKLIKELNRDIDENMKIRDIIFN